MKKIAVIFLASYPIIKIAFHLIKTKSVPDIETEPDINTIVYQMYFLYNNAAMVGLFALLHSISCYMQRIKSLYLKSSIITTISFKFYTLSLFIYSIWCFIVDALMLFGIGNKDSIIYTGISIVLLFISLWSFVLKR